LNRPLDDQSQPRIRLEADAVEVVLQLCSAGTHTWVTSPAMEFEASRNPDRARHAIITDVLRCAGETAAISRECEDLAGVLASQGLGAMDALHVAAAHCARCDVYLTTDDRLVRAVRRAGAVVAPRVVNPVTWLLEITER
jgi:predicted nucleic acid-binding protein